MPSKKSDPDKVATLAAILREELPGSTVTPKDIKQSGGVEFLIAREDAAQNILFVSEIWFRDDQYDPAEREDAVRKAAQCIRTHPGENYQLGLVGYQLEPYEPAEFS